MDRTLLEFEKLIIEHAKNYNKIEQLDFETFYDNFIDDFTTKLKIVLKSEHTSIIFYDQQDALEYLEKYSNQEFSIYIEYSAINFLDEITQEIYEKSEEFNNEELGIIINKMIQVFLDTYKKAHLDDLKVMIESLNEINREDSEELIYRFFNDEEFSYYLLYNYCETVIENQEYIKEEREILKPLVGENINSIIRRKLMYMFNYFLEEGLKQKEAEEIISDYLALDKSLIEYDTFLYYIIYEDKKMESSMKKYFILLMIYDFYLSANANKLFADYSQKDLEYIKFIENEELVDSYQLFKSDAVFRKYALKHFVTLNSFEPDQNNNDLSKQMKLKFSPLILLDNIKNKK